MLRLNNELMVTQTPDLVIYTIQTSTMGSRSVVKTAGGSFFPFVVRTLGLWTPFAIKTL